MQNRLEATNVDLWSCRPPVDEPKPTGCWRSRNFIGELCAPPAESVALSGMGVGCRYEHACMRCRQRFHVSRVNCPYQITMCLLESPSEAQSENIKTYDGVGMQPLYLTQNGIQEQVWSYEPPRGLPSSCIHHPSV